MKNEKTDYVGGETPKQKHPDSLFKLAGRVSTDFRNVLSTRSASQCRIY